MVDIRFCGTYYGVPVFEGLPLPTDVPSDVLRSVDRGAKLTHGEAAMVMRDLAREVLRQRAKAQD